ncbi:hypothetical protein AB0K89_05275 [Streptomyces cinnamoneus]|uniref:hypothetical protein n=1 Tax=Streptomyces cinnamoneus TaxID=53446 RepID=UPI00341224E7
MAGIVVGAIVGLTALGNVIHALQEQGSEPSRASKQASDPATGDSHRSKAAPSGKRYRLTVPSTLVGGQYTLVKDLSQTLDDGMAGQRSGSNERNVKGAGGQYTSTGPESQTLVVSGFHGDEITDPQRALASTFKGMNENEGVEVTAPPKDFTPPGSGEPISCESYAFTRSGQSGVAAVCGWSDHSTVATVTVADTSGRLPVDLDVLAKQTAQIRAEMRKPLD